MIKIPRDYLNSDQISSKLENNSENYWIKRGEVRVLDLFQQASNRVPAYKDFLKKSGIKSSSIKTISDFRSVPTVSKDTYLRQYPLSSLCWDGDLANLQSTIASTSGSTGEPFYFPRQSDQDLQYAALAELYLKVNFQIDKKTTLYIIGFPMGQWIGGVFTYEALKIITRRNNYPLSVITPGVNPLEIIKAVKTLGPYYDQIIIGSYGPFLKDTLDEAVALGFDWTQYNIGFIFAAEVFSESFRDYVADKVGVDNIYLKTLNQYGTVDLGTMAHETPISIMARRKAMEKKKLFNELFNKINRVPTLTQFLPDLFYFEEENENLYCSAYSGLPLVRYDLKDKGRVLTYSQLKDVCNSHQVDIEKEMNMINLSSTIWKLPFVYVYERSDFSVSYYAFCIYPETIRRSLLTTIAQESCTGKFHMSVKHDRNHNQKLAINIELKIHCQKSLQLNKTIANIVHEALLKENSEYRKTFQEKGRKVKPKVILWSHHHSKYFNPIIKQRWVA